MLIGTKICLGPVLQADGPLIFNWTNTHGLAVLNGVYRPTDQSRFDGWMSGLGNDPTRTVFAIRKQGDLRLLGYVQIANIHPAIHSAEMGILIGGIADRGQGYGQEAMRMAVEFCWRELNLQRLSLYVYGANDHAIRVYSKIGFVHEGLLRRAGYVDGRYVDVTVMGMLRRDGEEWHLLGQADRLPDASAQGDAERAWMSSCL